MVTRRTRSAGAALLAAAVALGLTACGSDSTESSGTGAGSQPPASDAKTTLTMWHYLDVEPIIDLYETAHPNVTINFTKQPATGYDQKLITAVKAGNGPDIAQAPYQQLPTLVAGGALADISKMLPAGVEEKFVPGTWSQVKLGDAVYGTPEDSGPMGLFYRNDLFKKYGVAVPTTWQEFTKAAEVIRKTGNYITAFSPAPGDVYWFSGLCMQNGAQWFGVEGEKWRVNINDPKCKEVADYWQDLIDRDLVKVENFFSDGWNAGLNSGKILSLPSAAWMVGFLQSSAPGTSGKWRVAPMPAWRVGDPAAGNWGGSAVSVTKSSKNMPAAVDFVTWMNTDEKAVALGVQKLGLYPASRAALDSEVVRVKPKFFGGQDVNEIFGEAAANVNGQWTWGPTMVQTSTDLSAAFGKAVEGGASLADSLDAVQAGTVKHMQSQGFAISE